MPRSSETKQGFANHSFTLPNHLWIRVVAAVTAGREADPQLTMTKFVQFALEHYLAEYFPPHLTCPNCGSPNAILQDGRAFCAACIHYWYPDSDPEVAK